MEQDAGSRNLLNHLLNAVLSFYAMEIEFSSGHEESKNIERSMKMLLRWTSPSVVFTTSNEKELVDCVSIYESSAL